MTEESLEKACNKIGEIRSLEILCGYKSIISNDCWKSPVKAGLLTEEEFQAILDEANEKIRERARKALEIAKQEFEAL